MPGLAAVSGRALDVGMVVTACLFGLRHGVDWDHIAAITDLTGSPAAPRRSMLLATCYALGHALVVFALGIGAVVFAERLPSGVDSVMERIVGATLLLLGVYVIVSLVRHGRQFQMRSRWMLVLAVGRRSCDAVRARLVKPRPREFVVFEHEHPHRHDVDHGHTHTHTATNVASRSVPAPDHPAMTADPTRDTGGEPHRHRHRHVLPVPDDPFAGGPGVAGAFGIGALHGVGAETPTQVVVFVGAAGASGALAGASMLAAFIVGLLVSNTVIAAAATFGNITSARRFPLYAGLSIVTAVFSLVMGGVFVAGHAGSLPSILGG